MHSREQKETCKEAKLDSSTQYVAFIIQTFLKRKFIAIYFESSCIVYVTCFYFPFLTLNLFQYLNIWYVSFSFIYSIFKFWCLSLNKKKKKNVFSSYLIEEEGIAEEHMGLESEAPLIISVMQVTFLPLVSFGSSVIEGYTYLPYFCPLANNSSFYEWGWNAILYLKALWNVSRETQ